MAKLRVPGCCLFPQGCKFLLWGIPKAQRPPARDQSLPGQHGHSQPPPLHQPLWVLHPACFCRKKGTGASSPAAQSPSAPILLGALSTSRVCVGPTAHGDSSVPPTLAVPAVESLRSCTFAAVGPQGKEQRSHFHLQPHWEWRERPTEKTSVCKTRQSAGNFPLAFRGWFFSLSLPLFKEGRHSIRTVQNNQSLARHMCHVQPALADDPLLHQGSTSQMVNDAVVFQRGEGMG